MLYFLSCSADRDLCISTSRKERLSSVSVKPLSQNLVILIITARPFRVRKHCFLPVCLPVNSSVFLSIALRRIPLHRSTDALQDEVYGPTKYMNTRYKIKLLPSSGAFVGVAMLPHHNMHARGSLVISFAEEEESGSQLCYEHAESRATIGWNSNAELSNDWIRAYWPDIRRMSYGPSSDNYHHHQ
jgi:hypothetical protein